MLVAGLWPALPQIGSDGASFTTFCVCSGNPSVCVSRILPRHTHFGLAVVGPKGAVFYSHIVYF